jgi:hypothetical protein
MQRIHAELFQHGVAVPDSAIRSAQTRAMLASKDIVLTEAARQRIRVGSTMIDATDAEALPLKDQLTRFGMRQPACRVLVDNHYGIGGLLAVAIWSEYGDCRRFSRSDQAVRHTGLDVKVDSSDQRRAGGYLTRQGPATLRCGQDRSLQHHGSLRRSAPATRTPASFLAGRPYNTDAIALPELTGDIRITIVVADDITFVEHPGNAERPHTAAHRPTPSLHRPSGWSRSFVLASLRALHLDQRLRPGAPAPRGP